MRLFWAIMEGRTDADWSLNGLPNAGRMDEAARIVNMAFWLSHDIRRDVVLYITFTGPSDPPKTVKFVGGELRKTSPDERSVAAIIRKALGESTTKEWKRVHYGVYVSKKGVEEILKEVSVPVVVLDENGERGKVRENVMYVVGGPYGIPEAEREKFEKFPKLRIGSRIYTASQTVCAINLLLDGVCE